MYGITDKSVWELYQQGYVASQPGSTQVQAAAQPAGAFEELARIELDARCAQSWVVTLGPLADGTRSGPQGADARFAPQSVLEAFAIVEWSSGRLGAPAWAVVDWNVGQQFSVYGSFVRVAGGVRSFDPNAIPSATRLSASISPGYTDTRALRTVIYPTPIGAASSAELPVPPFARTVTLSASAPDPLPNTTRLRGRTVAGGTDIWVQGPTQVFPGNQMLESVAIRLPLGTNHVVVDNPGAAALDNARLAYELAL